MLAAPSDLNEAEVAGVVEAQWGMAVSAIEYLPVGFGSHHFGVVADGRNWFVTVDDLRPDIELVGSRLTAALETACALSESGLGFVVAPIRSTSGGVTAIVDEHYSVAVFPHVDGITHGWGSFDSPAQRLGVLARVVELHGVPRPPGGKARSDELTLEARPGLEQALSGHRWGRGPYGQSTGRLVALNSGVITGLLDQFDRLVTGIRGRPDRWVITHGEPHRGNIITTNDGVVLVDWDTVLIAPPERDLWWFVAEEPALADEYERRTGTAVDPGAIELYRLRWTLDDIALFVAQFSLDHADDANTRASFDALTAYFPSP